MFNSVQVARVCRPNDTERQWFENELSMVLWQVIYQLGVLDASRRPDDIIVELEEGQDWREYIQVSYGNVAVIFKSDKC